MRRTIRCRKPSISRRRFRQGQVILPKVIRQRLEWDAGTRLIVEETPDGVLLKHAPLFEPSEPKDVFGLLSFSGAEIAGRYGGGRLAEVRRRHDAIEARQP
ncbi:AbrB/MazE/SpoVT family DNA-binding domain-containing protein [Sinorhizobium meliloti]|uniref:AbrB/MazE/SpoVT family DNA-binding domain-containing protein n=1 Tax=Rhizobium meliloti TaxID=382 RepID=UPI00399A9FAA